MLSILLLLFHFCYSNIFALIIVIAIANKSKNDIGSNREKSNIAVVQKKGTFLLRQYFILDMDTINNCIDAAAYNSVNHYKKVYLPTYHVFRDSTQMVTKLKLCQNFLKKKGKLKLWQNENCDLTKMVTKLKLWQQ